MSGTDGALRLIELTSARLCQDISGLIEPLEHAFAATAGQAQCDANQAGGMPGSARVLTIRLALRRAAWGPTGEPMEVAMIRSLAGGLPEPVMLDLTGLDPDTVFPAVTGRIVLNLLLLAADSLPAGGTIVLAGAAADLFLRIAGPAAGWPAGMAVCLTDETEARAALTEGRSLQMALTALLAHSAGIRLSVLFSTVGISQPAILRLGG